ncbi:hypothetical protein WA026_010938, partial [Henosepilachna vigintioctopunctata]
MSYLLLSRLRQFHGNLQSAHSVASPHNNVLYVRRSYLIRDLQYWLLKKIKKSPPHCAHIKHGEVMKASEKSKGGQ